ncbi:thioredoxin family protein [Oscillatoria sp. FACHB-1406]|uniref:thioredoxin family protein n=1 Tax=Oscillatoria sp. FACHB-1406 TaxID=2692846 RepID=UPI00168289B3|nr:thioredoxin family protein [Oscillatoria sp. FACHB-1406]MBD2579735.1 thioredoxin family protein [Oscillatoria sp. FACHB-1406]
MTENSSLKPTDNGSRLRNIILALVAVILSVALFLGLQSQTESVSLQTQAEESTPLEVAIANDKPTLIEFYADWCTSCQAMAGDLAELKKEYASSVNFVMLNVDNNKWLPEILRYRIDGIPHFVYLNRKGDAIAQTIGEQPRTILAADLDALVADAPLPHASATGKTSNFSAQTQPKATAGEDPRSHGAQVK